MAIFLPESEDIYFSKTKEYFQEVISSYANGNYRSANVMLYSVAICDMLLKLQELKDMYNDRIASEILASYKINSEQKSSRSKSAWEKDFIDSVYKKTELLDLESYTHLNHLYDDRNFSAHPALNDNYELISPSQEETIANIRNILTEILIKPPIFVTKILDTLLNDLSDKKSIFEHDADNLSIYLNNKYFSRMPKTMKINTFRSLWKLCFKLIEDEDCVKNRLINRRALEILSNDTDLNLEFIIKEEDKFYTLAVDFNCEWNLIIYLSRFPAVYYVLPMEVKMQIDRFIDENYEGKLISWFKRKNLSNHIEYLLCEDFNTIYEPVAKYMEKTYKEHGQLNDLIDLFIEYFYSSGSFDIANDRYEVTIKPYIDYFSKKQYDRLFECMNINSQIFNRNAAYSTNTHLIKKYIELYGDNFEPEKYENLNFDTSIIISTPDFEEFEEIMDDDLTV